MTIQFANTTFPGLHGRVDEKAPQLAMTETHFHGLIGNSVILAGVESRLLDVEHWLFDNYTDFIDINIKLREYDRLAAQMQVGNLSVKGTPAADSHQLYKNCIFLSYERLPLPGAQGNAPLPDPAGTVDGGYHVWGVLHFKQLVVD